MKHGERSIILPVIMAGGSGTRLWPLSRQSFPKQFLPLLSDETMLQSTYARLDGFEHLPPLVICGEAHRFTVAEQIRLSGDKGTTIILEPEGRNTAPALALAALHAIRDGDDPLLLALSADHLISDVDAFQTSVSIAKDFAQAGNLVTFGVTPTKAETGYGYIRRGAANERGGFDVAEFVEKPNLKTAEAYLASNQFYWNSGIFLFKASNYLQTLRTEHLEMFEACEQAMKQANSDNDFVRPNKKTFLSCPSESIDYAVMEPLCSKNKPSTNVTVIPMDCGWSDIGSWSALWDVSKKDGNGNTLKGDVLSYDTQNCLVQSTGKLVATIGLSDTIIIETSDAIMVAAKDKAQDVRKVVEILDKKQRDEVRFHRKIYRHWGSYQVIDKGKKFQVKRLIVKPGGVLSLQTHQYRAEHWVVVSGTAKVTKGSDSFLLGENESTYIPIDVKHRLENPTTVDLEIIETQSGVYFGEDDITRFEGNAIKS